MPALAPYRVHAEVEHGAESRSIEPQPEPVGDVFWDFVKSHELQTVPQNSRGLLKSKRKKNNWRTAILHRSQYVCTARLCYIIVLDLCYINRKMTMRYMGYVEVHGLLG